VILSQTFYLKQINNGHSKFMKRGFAFPRFSFEGKKHSNIEQDKGKDLHR